MSNAGASNTGTYFNCECCQAAGMAHNFTQVTTVFGPKIHCPKCRFHATPCRPLYAARKPDSWLRKHFVEILAALAVVAVLAFIVSGGVR